MSDGSSDGGMTWVDVVQFVIMAIMLMMILFNTKVALDLTSRISDVEHVSHNHEEEEDERLVFPTTSELENLAPGAGGARK